MKLFNLLVWQNRLKYHSFIQRLYLLKNLSVKFPATLNIEPTNYCNLFCVFCPVERMKRRKGAMSLVLYQKLIDQVKHSRKRLAVLWLNKDGEPLLNRKIDKFIRDAKERKIAHRLELYTNGTLLGEATSRKIILSGLDSLVVSLDAVGPREFVNLKGKNLYHRVVANVENFLKIRKNLNKNKPILSIKMVDMGNKEDLEEFENFWRKKAENVTIQPLHEWEGSMPKSQTSNLKSQKDKKRYACNLPWLSPAITWDGKVMPCCVNYEENELVMGDSNRDSLVEIYQGTKYKDLRQAHLKKDFSNYPTCQKCSFWQQLPNMEGYLRILNSR